MHRAAAIEFIDLRCERKIEFPDRQRLVATIPPNRFVRYRAVRHPKFDVLFVRAHALERALVRDTARAKLHRRVPLPGRLQARQFAERFQSYFVQTDFRIEAQRRLQIFRL